MAEPAGISIRRHRARCGDRATAGGTSGEGAPGSTGTSYLFLTVASGNDAARGLSPALRAAFSTDGIDLDPEPMRVPGAKATTRLASQTFVELTFPLAAHFHNLLPVAKVGERIGRDHLRRAVRDPEVRGRLLAEDAERRAARAVRRAGGARPAGRSVPARRRGQVQRDRRDADSRRPRRRHENRSRRKL